MTERRLQRLVDSPAPIEDFVESLIRGEKDRAATLMERGVKKALTPSPEEAAMHAGGHLVGAGGALVGAPVAAHHLTRGDSDLKKKGSGMVRQLVKEAVVGSALRSALGGSVLGAGVGAGTGAIAAPSGERGKGALRGAAIGAGTGAIGGGMIGGAQGRYMQRVKGLHDEAGAALDQWGGKVDEAYEELRGLQRSAMSKDPAASRAAMDAIEPKTLEYEKLVRSAPPRTVVTDSSQGERALELGGHAVGAGGALIAAPVVAHQLAKRDERMRKGASAQAEGFAEELLKIALKGEGGFLTGLRQAFLRTPAEEGVRTLKKVKKGLSAPSTQAQLQLMKAKKARGLPAF